MKDMEGLVRSLSRLSGYDEPHYGDHVDIHGSSKPDLDNPANQLMAEHLEAEAERLRELAMPTEGKEAAKALREKEEGGSNEDDSPAQHKFEEEVAKLANKYKLKRKGVGDHTFFGRMSEDDAEAEKYMGFQKSGHEAVDKERDYVINSLLTAPFLNRPKAKKNDERNMEEILTQAREDEKHLPEGEQLALKEDRGAFPGVLDGIEELHP